MSELLKLVQDASVLKYVLALLALVLLAIGPVLVSVSAGWVGELLGCNINEGGTDECVRYGIPFGSVLNPLGVVGWLSLLTIPAAGLLAIPWAIAFLIKLVHVVTSAV